MRAMNFMRGFFDVECNRVLSAGFIGGTLSGLSPDKLMGLAVGVVTFLYITVKLIKQLRDWRKSDKD